LPPPAYGRWWRTLSPGRRHCEEASKGWSRCLDFTLSATWRLPGAPAPPSNWGHHGGCFIICSGRIPVLPCSFLHLYPVLPTHGNHRDWFKVEGLPSLYCSMGRHSFVFGLSVLFPYLRPSNTQKAELRFEHMPFNSSYHALATSS
jgi:hypothetical protein